MLLLSPWVIEMISNNQKYFPFYIVIIVVLTCYWRQRGGEDRMTTLQSLQSVRAELTRRLQPTNKIDCGEIIVNKTCPSDILFVGLYCPLQVGDTTRCLIQKERKRFSPYKRMRRMLYITNLPSCIPVQLLAWMVDGYFYFL